jgi:hypothetical protein
MNNRGFSLPKHGIPADNQKNGPGSKINTKKADPQVPHEFVQPNKQAHQTAGRNPPIQPDISNWYTRQQAADTLRVSVTTIATYERQGKLNPRYAYRADSRNIEHRVAVYDPEDVRKLLRFNARPDAQESGETAARCFELFNEGKSMRGVVIELRLRPDLVKQLYASWEETGSVQESGLVITVAAKKDLESLVGNFSTIDGLRKCIQDLMESIDDELPITPADADREEA